MGMVAGRRQTGTIHMRRLWAARLGPYVWLAPAVILFFIFTLLPLLVGLGLSFFSWDGLSAARFVGIQNYIDAMHDGTYWTAIEHNVTYAVGTVAGKMVLGFGLALVLNRALPGRAIFRTALFLPVVLSFVVVGLMWNWIYDYNSGLVNSGLGAIGLGNLKEAWLGSISLALYALIVVDIWKWFGFHMVIFLAGLQSIPSELYEAARIDGSTTWDEVRLITLPLMVPVIMINVILASSGAFNVFDIVYVMTTGGPVNATNVAMVDIYTEAFQFNQFGYASALSIVQLILVSAISLVILRLLRRERYF
jgi:raffinose/stachyose/melibiose transport system permease protein